MGQWGVCYIMGQCGVCYIMGQWGVCYIMGQWGGCYIMGQWGVCYIIGQWGVCYIMGQWGKFRVKFGVCYIMGQWGKFRVCLHILLRQFFVVFHQKICLFIIFISFSDKASNFHHKILTNLKLELMIRNCQWNCMYNIEI